jgi:phosphoenolpyruvate-protein kinase (PTS system EI component)
VLELMETDLSEVILSTLHASVTSIVPILPQVRGIVCQGGGATSHLAIVSRQFGLPCIVGAHFERPAEEVDGFELTMTEDGRVLLVQEPDE